MVRRPDTYDTHDYRLLVRAAESKATLCAVEGRCRATPSPVRSPRESPESPRDQPLDIQVVRDSSAAASDVTTLIERADAGDVRAREVLFSALYDELHRLARREVLRLGSYSPLGATTLLHEAYLAFGTREGLSFPDESRFLAYAARAMRGLIVDRVRAQHANKRGGGLRETTLDGNYAPDTAEAEELLAVHDALGELEAVEPLLAQVVDLHFFCGFSFNEIAKAHGISERTVQRQWQKARLYLRHALNAADERESAR